LCNAIWGKHNGGALTTNDLKSTDYQWVGFDTVVGPGLFIPGHWIEGLKRQASSEAPLP